MDVVNQRMELPQEEKLAQVEELVKHQISRVEKILQSSLTRTAALIEQQIKRAKEDEEKRQDIEKNKIIPNNDIIKDQNVQENKLNDASVSTVSLGNVLLNSVHTQVSSKTFKTVGTNTDEIIKLQSQISEDTPVQLTLDQQLVIFDSTADRKRQQFAGRKIYKHKVKKVNGPICTISISVDQTPERTSSNTENSPEYRRIVVETTNRGSSGSDVFVFSDALQKNHEFCNKGSKLADISQTVTSNEQCVDKEKLTLDSDVSEFHTNCQIKDDVPQTVSSLNESIINNLAKTQIKGVGVESDFFEISNTTHERTTSKSETIMPHVKKCDVSVSSDSSSRTMLMDYVKPKRHKRKAKKTKEFRDNESEMSVSSHQKEELSRDVTKYTPERNDLKSFRITKGHTRKKTCDQDKRVKSDGDNFQSSAPELHNTQKAECKRHIEMTCVSERNRSSNSNATGHSQSGRRQNIDQSKRRISCESSKHHELADDSDKTDKKSFSNHKPNSLHETASVSSDNTSCGLSGNLSQASVEYHKLENEHWVSSKALTNVKLELNDITNNIACDRSVDERAIKYSLFDSADGIPATVDGTHSNQNTEHYEVEYHDSNGHVPLLQRVEEAATREVLCNSNKVEKETNLKLKEDESDQTDTSEIEQQKSNNRTKELETESIQNDISFNNREQSPSVTDIGDDNVLDLVTSLDNTPTMIQTVLKSESMPDIQNSCEKTLPSAQTLLDDSSSTARSFEDKYHLVMNALERHLIVSQASTDSNDTPSDDIKLHNTISKGGRCRSKSVSLENSVSSSKALKNVPLSEPVISKTKRKQRAQLSSELHSQVTTSEDAVQERRFSDSNKNIQLRDKVSSTEEQSKCVDVISVSKSESCFKIDDSMTTTSGRLDSLIDNRDIEDDGECTLNECLNDNNLNISPKLEINKTQTESIDSNIDDNSVSVPLTSNSYCDIVTSGTSFDFEIKESSASVQCPKSEVSNRKDKVIDGRCSNIDNYVGESSSSNQLDSTDTEGLDSSFYDRSAPRNDIRIANEPSSFDSDVSFVAESSVSSLKVSVPANDKEKTQHHNASDSSVSIPLSLEYYSDLVTPVTSLRYVIDEWSEPLGKPFKIKQKPKRINRKKIITDVHVNTGGENRKQLQSLRRTSTPCHISKNDSATSSLHESNLVQGESELSTSVIQYSSINELSNTENGNTSNSINDDEHNNPESNQVRTAVSHDDSFLSTSSEVAYQHRPHVTKDPVLRSTNSSLCRGLEDEATTTEDVASSILPEDVDDTTDIDEQLQMEETDFSEITDVLGTSTETFTKIENPNFKPNV